MSEDDAKDIAKSTVTEMGMRRGWHHIIVRCGPNTTKDFMERSETGVVLGDNDIFSWTSVPSTKKPRVTAATRLSWARTPTTPARSATSTKMSEEAREYWFDSGVTGRASPRSPSRPPRISVGS